MKIKNSFEIILLTILTLPFIYISIIWNLLPEIIPTHFNIDGVADDWGSKWTIFIMPCISFPMYFILRFVPRIDPRFKNYQLFQRSYNYIRLAVHLLLASITVFIVQITLNNSLANMGAKWIFILVLIFFSIMGNFMRTIRSNYFAGIRTPWTLENETVWRKTHEFSGRLWFYGGLILSLITLFLNDKWTLIIIFPLLILMAGIIPITYSYFCYRNLKRQSSIKP
ncbi:MAG TPA: hypothetical protein DCQ93_06390 [Bacteroidetes bacterium]|nr:hypothetical protein [Bacteroidota bacterium]